MSAIMTEVQLRLSLGFLQWLANPVFARADPQLTSARSRKGPGFLL